MPTSGREPTQVRHRGALTGYLASLRLKVAARHLRGRTGRVLDFGCGEGALAGLVPPSQYVGVDVSPQAVAAARAAYPAHRFDLITDIGAWQAATAPGLFETIVALAVMEHLADPAQVVAMFRDLLQPAGQVLLTTPHPRAERIYRVGASLGLFSGCGVEEHRSLLGRAHVETFSERAGLRVVKHGTFLMGCNQVFVLAARRGT